MKKIYWSGDRFITENLDTKQIEHVNQHTVDMFHDLRRDILIELEELFDRVDDGYASNKYKKEVLEVAVREMSHVLGLLKIIRTNL